MRPAAAQHDAGQKAHHGERHHRHNQPAPEPSLEQVVLDLARDFVELGNRHDLARPGFADGAVDLQERHPFGALQRVLGVVQFVELGRHLAGPGASQVVGRLEAPADQLRPAAVGDEAALLPDLEGGEATAERALRQGLVERPARPFRQDVPVADVGQKRRDHAVDVEGRRGRGVAGDVVLDLPRHPQADHDHAGQENGAAGERELAGER